MKVSILLLFITIALFIGSIDLAVQGNIQKREKYKDMVNASVLIRSDFSYGSGVFIEDNVIVTAAHVLEQSNFTVELADGTMLEADDFYVDAKEDVGFIFVDANELHITKISVLPGDIGDSVYSVGSPHYTYFKFTLSKGILSHLDRDEYEWEDLLQADVLSGPGSSGGPLYDSQGRLIGIVVANPCPNRNGNITLCESGKSILEAYERCMNERNAAK